MKTTQARPTHVLLAEDDPDLRALLGSVLRADGHHVTEATDGWELHRRVALMDGPEAAVDLVLSDVRMPGPSVWATLDQPRARGARAPAVVLMSAFADEGVHRRARELGAAMFDKPFEADDLRTCIGNMLSHVHRWQPKRALPRILVADDDTELRRLVAGELRKLGCEVEEANSGFALLDRLGDAELDVDRYALVVTDVRMPGVTGLSVLRGLRASDSARLGGTPVLLMTAFGDDATRAEARQLGALLLDKPFDLEELRMWSQLLLDRPPERA